VVLASEGYPQSPETGRALSGLDAAASVEGVHLAHAATARSEDGLIATGGRVLNVVAVGDSFTEARARVYESLGRIELDGGHYRSDIAARVAD
jgi:phosphoribosylamine--glycine ligase